MQNFLFDIEEKEIRQQRYKARDLRGSQWWKRRIAKGICYYCNQSFSPKDLTMDHIVPVSRGGKSTKGNVVPACKKCNNKKKSKLPIEWEQIL